MRESVRQDLIRIACDIHLSACSSLSIIELSTIHVNIAIALAMQRAVSGCKYASARVFMRRAHSEPTSRSPPLARSLIRFAML